MKLEDRILALRREKDNDDWHVPKIGVYHASTLYDIYKGTLKPKNFFKPVKFDDKTLLTFEIGKMYHDYVQKLFTEAIIEHPIKIQIDDFIIVGRVDMILGDFPCELKTCSQIPKKYYASHEIQLQAYLAGLKKDVGYLTYIEKNPRLFITKNFKITKNDFLFNSVIEKVKQFHEQLKVEADSLTLTNNIKTK